METEVVVVYAERAPMNGIENPGPHQLYRNPRIALETRPLGHLHPNNIRVEMIYAGICGTDVHLVEVNPILDVANRTAKTMVELAGSLLGKQIF